MAAKKRYKGESAKAFATRKKKKGKSRVKAMGFLASDEFANKIATKINEKIDIPFVSEEKEQVFFERVVDIVTDLMEGVFKGK